MGKKLPVQRRGKGSIYRSSIKNKIGSIKYSTDADGKMEGKVSNIIHLQGHTAPIALIRRGNEKFYMVAAEGMYSGMDLNQKISVGNILQIGEIPEGTCIYNIESRPMDGGKFARSAGAYATILSKEGGKINIKLSSGNTRTFNNMCRATIGIAAGGGRKEKPYGSAGKKYNCLSSSKLYPVVSGTAKNPVDHPHGGGGHQHVGKTKTPGGNAPPGRKVGSIAARKSKIKKENKKNKKK